MINSAVLHRQYLRAAREGYSTRHHSPLLASGRRRTCRGGSLLDAGAPRFVPSVFGSGTDGVVLSTGGHRGLLTRLKRHSWEG